MPQLLIWKTEFGRCRRNLRTSIRYSMHISSHSLSTNWTPPELAKPIKLIHLFSFDTFCVNLSSDAVQGQTFCQVFNYFVQFNYAIVFYKGWSRTPFCPTCEPNMIKFYGCFYSLNFDKLLHFDHMCLWNKRPREQRWWPWLTVCLAYFAN